MIVLVGLMGSGKSSVGRLVADRIGARFADTDHLAEHRVGRTVAEVFALDGEAAFRRLEAEIVRDAVADEDLGVVALGGGSVTSELVRDALAADGLDVVWLRARPDTLVARMAPHEVASRPLLAGDPASVLARLSAEREPYHHAVAHRIIDVDDLAPDAVADVVVAGRP